MNSEFKQLVFQHCISTLKQRIADMEKDLADIQESANSEEKSSAGDKYETGRAMSHISRDMNAKQLFMLKKNYEELLAVNIHSNEPNIHKGSIVKLSNQQLIFIASSLGSIIVNHIKLVVVSVDAPISKLLIGRKNGDTFTLNNQKIKIEIVF